MRCNRGMYAFIAGNCGSASLGFTLIYQAGLAGQRISAFTRFPRFSHAPFPFAFRFQVGEMTRRPYSSVPPFSARRISSWVKWRTSSAYLRYLRRMKLGSLTSTAGILLICRTSSRNALVRVAPFLTRRSFRSVSFLWRRFRRFRWPPRSICRRSSSTFSSSSCKYTFARIGLANPPCGVPARLFCLASCRSRYPARRSFQMRLRKRSSRIFLRRRVTKTP